MDDEIDERIFDVLVSHPRITDIMIDLSIDPESLLLLLGRALPKMTNLQGVDFYARRDISTMQVSRIFQIFNNGIPSQEMELSIHFDNDYDGMVGALILFLRKPSDLTNLALYHFEGFDGLSANTFDLLCQALGTAPLANFLSFDWITVYCNQESWELQSL